ncbi:MAG TPA: DUF1549 domain-containing protein, partial [Verrucomicrobiales bacterium]|nr:DUF1549 domain-containing protein [Verrucomicrobiales bacterium]HIL70408.1 DUF1549 domain-containing protein [Verrucomicrobiota bacterium]
MFQSGMNPVIQSLSGKRFKIGGGGLFVVLFCSSAVAEKTVSYSRDIRPILANNCFACQGPDKRTRKAKLRLDNREDAHSESIVPGNLEESELYYRITTEDEDDLMPSHEPTKSLTQAEKDLIKQWILEGADCEIHWAYKAPIQAELPEVENRARANNPIDFFVINRLEQEGLTPAREAKRNSLIRRVSFDLTGLPPSQEEVESFVSDHSSDAYEKLVDRLLESDTYSEHMAGDLLPNPTLDQQIATGFNRAHVTTNEGGSIEEEVYVRNVQDRTTTFGTVFMGITTGCAVCHDHKFDPLKQKEFYQMSAYFNSLDGKPMDGNRKDPAPIMKVPSEAQKREVLSGQDRLAAVRKILREQVSAFKYHEPEKPRPAPMLEPVDLVWIEDSLPKGADATGDWKRVEKDPFPVLSGKKAFTQSAVGLGRQSFVGAKKPLKIKAGSRLFTYVYLDPLNPPREILLEWNDGSWDHRAYWGENLIESGDNETVSRYFAGNLPVAGEWVRLEVAASVVGFNPGSEIGGLAFLQYYGVTFRDKTGVVELARKEPKHNSFVVWIQDQRQLDKPEVPKELARLINQNKSELSTVEQHQLLDHFVEYVSLETRTLFAPAHQWVEVLKKQISDIEKGFPTSLVWKEAKQKRKAYILDRGLYNMKKSEVARMTPEFLPSFPEDASIDRLGLARRLAERGVRFTQIFHRGWDQHFKLPKDLPNQCRDIDQPVAALIKDLKQRSLLDDTLVVWGGEFGRTVYCQGELTSTEYGRDHHPKCFAMWMAGGG